MLLLIFAAFFLTFLAIILFLSLRFDDEVKKKWQVQTVDGYRSYIHTIESRKLYRHYKKRNILKTLSVLFVLLMTWSIYGLTGNPEVKSYFFSELMDKNPKLLSKQEKLVRLQALFFRSPYDGKLADALAVGYLEESHFQEAVNTYLDALRLNGETAPRLVGYGLALVGYEGGMITQEAQRAFQKAADLAPTDFYPRLLLADAFHQAGKTAQAVQFLQSFLDTMPKNFAGRSRVEKMMIRLLGSLNEPTEKRDRHQLEKLREVIILEEEGIGEGG
ncbi:tetratricopeptide repeat protein [Bartonella krasnovii]|uniref:Tetratricopeptide repeat protein n=1 Tax=Bartonella krasnovii TaxID=2267275 RepID=A0ABY3VVW9_9HYPH|nr:tetratricopeptide repeat protein [Bartonella krasnovii]UNF29494.1 tetratricopeptide repeat protein [Bartonella krasnovii]UNF35852.1 tetratricopeptide repeat protein [Bartonella krasnovii]UNF37472.1 tetratricopeptide repeat protein [Bartonella krasnovii]UNF39256.1 tetratricopeptide repeat protein [Bartonella krasnovii]UNF40892.1 tetratricopeptide repeat protein [Bartonella krasnovii]